MLWEDATIHDEHYRQQLATSDPDVPPLSLCGLPLLVLLSTRDGNNVSTRECHRKNRTSVMHLLIIEQV